LVDLFFDPEYGGYIFLRNVGWLSADYTALYPRRQYSSCLSVSLLVILTPHWMLRLCASSFVVCFTALSVPDIRVNTATSSPADDVHHYVNLQKLLLTKRFYFQ
jgi:hypothetical protein